MSDNATDGVAGETAPEASSPGLAPADGAHAPAPGSPEAAGPVAAPETEAETGAETAEPETDTATETAKTTAIAATPETAPTADLPLFAPVWSSKSRARGSLGGPSTADAEMSTSRKREAIWLIAATAVSLLGAPVGAVAAILSPMVFDPSQNVWNPAAWIAFVLIVTFWIVCIAAPFGAWVAYLRHQRVLTWLAMSLPAVWVIAAFASVQFLPG
jgi:hypothetical protein